jgi:hypothetical protein
MVRDWPDVIRQGQPRQDKRRRRYRSAMSTMASPQMILKLSGEFFKRNNPVDQAVRGAVEAVNWVVTFNSKMKLMRYKFYLAKEQLNKLENNLEENTPFNTGRKLNRTY